MGTYGGVSRITSVLLFTLVLASIAPPINIGIATAQSETMLPGIALVKLWSVSHMVYMAKFVGDKYVVLFESHGDVSLNGKYISVLGSGKHVWIYDVTTGKLIGVLQSDTDDVYGDTWEIESWKPFKARKVWDRSGFFSADSSRMVEDVEHTGTNARVVVTSSWDTIPIDWGFTDTTRAHFYAVQLDYSGSTLAVGYIYNSTLLVFKYDPSSNKYKLVFKHKETGYYGRRLQMTLDGRYILVGGLNYPYLDIWKWDNNAGTYVRIVHYKLPDPGGIGALGITDPWHVGYIIIGTKNGWAIIARLRVEKQNVPAGPGYLEVSSEKFEVLFKEKFAPDNSWVYNPFYDRWIPKTTRVLVASTHRDANRPGYLFAYDIITNTSYIEKFADPGSPQWSAAAISPSGNYVFVGNTLYAVVVRDTVPGATPLTPFLKFIGSTEFTVHHDLSTPLTIQMPKGSNWYTYVYGGRITIKRLYVNEVPVELVEDDDIRAGRLAEMARKGLIGFGQLGVKNARFDFMGLYTGYQLEDVLASSGASPSNYIAVAATTTFTPPPYFDTGYAWYAAYIHVPLNKPLNIYDNMLLTMQTSVYSKLLFYSPDKRALAIIGIPVDIGGGIGISTAAYSKLAGRVLIWYASRHGISLRTLAAVTTSQTAAKIAGVVGIAVAVWGAVDAALVKWGGLGNIEPRSWIIIAPVVEDKYGNKYTALALYLPLEESNNVKKYVDILKPYFDAMGYKDVGIMALYLGNTWKDYMSQLKSGFAPNITLDSLIESTIASKYGLKLDELKIVGIDVIVVTEVSAKETFWEWVTGGVKVDSITLIGSTGISVKAVLKGGTVTDPNKIATLIKSIIVNGNKFELTPGESGAYADFGFTSGVNKLTITFEGGRTGYFADIDVSLDVAVITLFSKIDDYGYAAKLHYDSNLMIRIKRIEILNMPYPMLRVERIFVYKYGSFKDDITEAFELKDKTPYPGSPTGYLYYYATTQNTKYIDPANGGTLMKCKTYMILYYYREPPDVSVRLFFNGTSPTSTLPQHLVVIVNSTVPQTVAVNVTIRVAYEKNGEIHNITVKSYSFETRAANISKKYIDIKSLVYRAIEAARTLKAVSFLEATAKIVKAEYDYLASNDYDRVVYYPPPSLPAPAPPGNYTVKVKALELRGGKWVPSPNATVIASYGSETYSTTTDENGVAMFRLHAGMWNFTVYKKGFKTYTIVVNVYRDMSILAFLSPATTPPAKNNTYSSLNITVLFNVYDITSGSPISNASIEAMYIGPMNTTYTVNATTNANGLAVLRLMPGNYNVTVNAANYTTYSRLITIDKNMIINIPLTPISVANATGYARLTVLTVYSDGKPYTGAHVEIRSNGTLVAAAATNSMGNATFLLRLGDYDVTVKVYERVYNRSYTETKHVSLASDTTIVFRVPWSSGKPPIYVNGTPYYWLTVEVTWSNGLPFAGANITVYNYTTREPIESLVTNSTGTARFLLPAFNMYTVEIDAVNPYTGDRRLYVLPVNLTDNRMITVRLPWTPAETELARNYTLVVYAYDVTDGHGVGDVTVIVSNGNLTWSGVTNETGYAEIVVPFPGLYHVTGLALNYEALDVDVFVVENVTRVNLPLSPVHLNYNVTPPPPLNETVPPITFNGSSYYWLSVQVLWKDGYPFHGANITVIDLSLNKTIATGITNGTGMVHFLIPANKTIKYTVYAVNPHNTSETYYAERVVNMTHHYYFIHMVPWRSKYYRAEVAVRFVKLVVHRGLGYFYGNMSHLVLIGIWTNKPQNITIEIALYNVTGRSWVENKTATISLENGLNTIYEWVSIGSKTGGLYRVFVNITGWEADTEPDNNYAWSNTVWIKPYTDFKLIITWRLVKQKMKYAILPGDIVEVDIGIVIPMNTTMYPLRFNWRINKINLLNMTEMLLHGGSEKLRVRSKGIVWRNITIKIPWTSKLVITAVINESLDDNPFNNNATVVIPIDPDVAITSVTIPGIVRGEGTIVIKLRSNIEPGKAIGWINIVDNTTSTLIKQLKVKLQPNMTITIPFKPRLKNPVAPAEEHTLTITYMGYDVYPANNRYVVKAMVANDKWVVAAAAAGIGLILIAALIAVARSIHSIVARHERRFVRKT